MLGDSLMKPQEFCIQMKVNCLSLQAMWTTKPLGYSLPIHHKQPLTLGVKQKWGT